MTNFELYNEVLTNNCLILFLEVFCCFHDSIKNCCCNFESTKYIEVEKDSMMLFLQVREYFS